MIITPDMHPDELLMEFDQPDELVVRDDPYGGPLKNLIRKSELPYFEKRDRIVNDLLIEKGLTMGELLNQLSSAEPSLETLNILNNIREETARRIQQSEQRKRHKRK